MELHEAERILRVVARRNVQGHEALIGDELEILAHVCDRQTSDSEIKNVFCESEFAVDGFFHHRNDHVLHLLVKEFWLFFASGLDNFEGEVHVT